MTGVPIRHLQTFRRVRIAQKPQVRVVNNSINLGYGASLKKGIRQAKGEIIVITDADCTYPANQIPILLEKLDAVDMAVGARTGNKVQIPFVRKPAKWALLKYARWMARADIKDLNSGLRTFRKKDALRFFPLLPDGFSFTSTITLAMHVNGMQVSYHPIDYNKGLGKVRSGRFATPSHSFLSSFEQRCIFAPCKCLEPYQGFY